MRHISNMRVFIFILSVVALAVGLINQQLFAESTHTNTGVVVFKSGDAQITRHQKTAYQTFKDDPILAGDKIETKNGRLQIELTDGTKISLQPNSTLEMTDYRFSQKPNESRFSATLSQGGLRAMTGNICQQTPNQCQLRTSFASIVGQKADYTVMVDVGLKITTNTGNVNVCNTNGCLSASGGQTITIKSANKPPQLANLSF